jgi:excisionase family DNA binding protein
MEKASEIGDPLKESSSMALPTTIDSNSPLLTEKEVAAYLGVSLSAARKWRVERRGPPFRKVSGTLVRYDPRALQQWIETQPMGGTRVEDGSVA